MSKRKIVSVLLKAIVLVAAVWGIVLCRTASGFMGGKAVWLYFTIQSNIWIAIVALLGVLFAAKKTPLPRWMSVTQLMMTVAITLTGVVYCFMLAPLMGDQAFILANVLTHVVVPIAAVLDFFVCSKELSLRQKDAFYVAIPPLYYLGFASVCYVLHVQFAPGICYPYFFLNWGSPAGAFGFCNELPFMGVMYYVAIMLSALLLVGWLFVVLSAKIKSSK